MARPVVHHRSEDFDPIFAKNLEALKTVFRTKHPVLTFAGSGTVAMEAAVTGVNSPGDKVLTLESGKFGQRWGLLGKAFGLDVIQIETEWGYATPPEEVEKALKAHPDIKAVYATLCETSTGALGDIETMGKIVGKTDALLAVDAVSGLAADRLETDAWGCDLVATSSQKALMLPPGLGLLSVSPKAEARMATATCPSFYASMKKAMKALKDGTTAFTPAISLMVGLGVALDMIQEEGIENVWARHKRHADALRAGGEALGVKVFSKAPANTVVSYEVPEGATYKGISGSLRGDFGLTIAGGQDRLKGKIFRMAAMGWADDKDVIQALGALGVALEKAGHKVPDRGAGVSAALELFA
jgi:aspartate aminotransferase-like enzyme